MRLVLQRQRKFSIPHFKSNAVKMGNAHRKNPNILGFDWRITATKERNLYLPRRKLKGNLIKVYMQDIKGNRRFLNLRRKRIIAKDKKLKMVKCKIDDFSFLKWHDLCLKEGTKGHHFCNLHTWNHNFHQLSWGFFHFFLEENILPAQTFKRQELKT